MVQYACTCEQKNINGHCMIYHKWGNWILGHHSPLCDSFSYRYSTRQPNSGQKVTGAVLCCCKCPSLPLCCVKFCGIMNFATEICHQPCLYWCWLCNSPGWFGGGSMWGMADWRDLVELALGVVAVKGMDMARVLRIWAWIALTMSPREARKVLFLAFLSWLNPAWNFAHPFLHHHHYHHHHHHHLIVPGYPATRPSPPPTLSTIQNTKIYSNSNTG